MSEPLVFGSVCSGIEAATVAWSPRGWRPSFYSEIDPFPRAVLAHRHSGVPLHGDFTTIQEGDYAAIDLLVGGTPCQSFSVAGKRLGLDDPRGNLAIEYCSLARRLRPRWLTWENVPGVLSSNGGRDFGAFLGLLGECGYGWAYRVLDAQFIRVDGYARAVPQRRRRVILVGYLGDWRRAAAVLFEPESMRGDTPPRREAGQRAAPTISARTQGGGGLGTDFELDGGLTPIKLITDDVSHALNAGGMGRQDYETETMVAHALRADGFDASEDGTGRGTPLVPVAFDLRGREGGAQFEGPHNTPNIRASSGGSSRSYVAESWAVRRLTPRECERLQGFPDGYTDVPYRKRNWTADGPRYKALGNSMAVNCMRWVGQRIQMVEDLIREGKI